MPIVNFINWYSKIFIGKVMTNSQESFNMDMINH